MTCGTTAVLPRSPPKITRFPIAPAETTWTIVNPAECATGVVPSAPRVTVNIDPATFVTAISSVGASGSAMWNWVGGLAALDAAGNEIGDATVQDWVPLVAVCAAATVVEGWFA